MTFFSHFHSEIIESIQRGTEFYWSGYITDNSWRLCLVAPEQTGDINQYKHLVSKGKHVYMRRSRIYWKSPQMCVAFGLVGGALMFQINILLFVYEKYVAFLS